MYLQSAKFFIYYVTLKPNVFIQYVFFRFVRSFCSISSLVLLKVLRLPLFLIEYVRIHKLYLPLTTCLLLFLILLIFQCFVKKQRKKISWIIIIIMFLLIYLLSYSRWVLKVVGRREVRNLFYILSLKRKILKMQKIPEKILHLIGLHSI